MKSHYKYFKMYYNNKYLILGIGLDMAVSQTNVLNSCISGFVLFWPIY